jgi:hypothetical protein
LMLAEINDHADDKCRADIGKIGYIERLMNNFLAEKHIRQ